MSGRPLAQMLMKAEKEKSKSSYFNKKFVSSDLHIEVKNHEKMQM